MSKRKEKREAETSSQILDMKVPPSPFFRDQESSRERGGWKWRESRESSGKHCVCRPCFVAEAESSRRRQNVNKWRKTLSLLPSRSSCSSLSLPHGRARAACAFVQNSARMAKIKKGKNRSMCYSVLRRNNPLSSLSLILNYPEMIFSSNDVAEGHLAFSSSSSLPFPLFLPFGGITDPTFRKSKAERSPLSSHNP